MAPLVDFDFLTPTDFELAQLTEFGLATGTKPRHLPGSLCLMSRLRRAYFGQVLFSRTLQHTVQTRCLPSWTLTM